MKRALSLLTALAMPTTDPVVTARGTVRWVGIYKDPNGAYAPRLYTLEP